ncbi:MAG: sigma-70 family RNA polymerase sigma factor [Isosphaeraceae bacterium]|nr:sigma-70 family RNA polymerase sigma factor [Isosphaeraceae bacterium]
MERTIPDDVASAPLTPPPSGEEAARNERFIRSLTDHQGGLFVYLVSLLGDAHEARNVLQETNLVLWRRSSELVDGTDFGAWSRAIAHYQFLAFLRDKKRDRHIFDAELLSRLAERAQPAADSEERRVALRTCLAELPDSLRLLISLRYSAGTSINELAKRVGKSESAVKMALARTRQKLMECIDKRLAAEG